jgi:hypothetical protein
MSHFFSKQLFARFVGYAYQQVSNDTGGNPQFGGLKSRVLGIGSPGRISVSGGGRAGLREP